MATMTVTLPDPLADWVEAQARTGRYGDAGDYVRDLIRRDQERAAWVAELQPLLDEGFESGVSDLSMDEIMEMGRKRVRNHGL